MAYILGLVVVGLLFLSLHYFTELSKSQKLLVTLALFGIIFSAIAYNTYSNEQSQKLLDVVRAFNQDKTVKCNGVDVNNSNYSLSIGTYTFIGKPNTPYFNQMISASDCQ